MSTDKKEEKFLTSQDLEKFEFLMKLRSSQKVNCDPVLQMSLDLLNKIKASTVHEDEHCIMIRKNDLISTYKG